MSEKNASEAAEVIRLARCIVARSKAVKLESDREHKGSRRDELTQGRRKFS